MIYRENHLLRDKSFFVCVLRRQIKNPLSSGGSPVLKPEEPIPSVMVINKNRTSILFVMAMKLNFSDGYFT